MGFRDLGRSRRRQSRDDVQDMDKHDTQIIDRAVTKARLIITPLESHRREVFASYPTGEGIFSRESVDECNHFYPLEASQLTSTDISIYRKEELCLKVIPNHDHPAISIVFPMSMQDPDLFRCFLVGAQSLHDWRRDPYNVNRTHDMLKLQNKAISSLRRRLAGPEAHLDDGLLISITHLMIADVSRIYL